MGSMVPLSRWLKRRSWQKSAHNFNKQWSLDKAQEEMIAWQHRRGQPTRKASQFLGIPSNKNIWSAGSEDQKKLSMRQMSKL
jgi:hypothetical protein